MSSVMNSAILSLLASAATVAARGSYVEEITVDGTKYPGNLASTNAPQNAAPQSIAWSSKALDPGFVAPSKFGSDDIICHIGSENAAGSAPVKAGGKVDLRWNTWLKSHHGPILTYLANCGTSCATVKKASLKFFKIAESGLLDGSAPPGKWATDELRANGLTYSVSIPASIAVGKYVLRHEIIALHAASTAGGAQSYPFCINLEVTGGGSDAPEGVLGTALYTPTDPGIQVSIDTAPLTYQIPGPPLFSGGGGGSYPPTTTTPGEPSYSASTTLLSNTRSSSAATSTASHSSHEKEKSEKKDGEESDSGSDSDGDGNSDSDSDSDEDCD
ncbi:hypothetical protein PZA11_006445 [Diplocarpon coronariae]